MKAYNYIFHLNSKSILFILQGPAKKVLNRYERKLKEAADKKKHKAASRAITISMEGRNMPL